MNIINNNNNINNNTNDYICQTIALMMVIKIQHYYD